MEPLKRGCTRRAWLRGLGGVLGGAGLGALGFGALAGPGREGPAHPGALISLWLEGGPSQLETFDPHPGQRIAYGTQAIATAAPGVQLAAGFERLAAQMGDVSLIRSMVSKEGDHERGSYYLKRGYRPQPTILHPALGALVCEHLPAQGVEIPRHVSILPGRWPARGGLLGARLDAFKLGDPADPVPDVSARVSASRRARRRTDLELVEGSFARGRGAQVAATRHRETIAAAEAMMSSAQLGAFDLSSEPAAVRERYGDSAFGRGCLAARRLVEVGVRAIEVTLDGWDTHVNNHEQSAGLVAQLDPAFAALIEDLRERDLLAHTVVVCGGEFGRTPGLNRLEGRDHWPHGFSMALAGGGLRGGHVTGATDPEGGRAVESPTAVADVHATILSALGIDPELELVTSAGRPLRLSEGRVLGELLGSG